MMMNALILIAALAAQPEVALEAHARRMGAEYELSISGKSRGIPDGSIASLRFRRMANRVDWAARSIVTQPLDRAWGRFASVERGAFRHRELLDGPGEVEVDVSLQQEGSAEAPPCLTRTVRVGSVPEVLG